MAREDRGAYRYIKRREASTLLVLEPSDIKEEVVSS